jgi:UV DNA damage endonuclease
MEIYMSLAVCCQWLQGRVKRDGTTVYENIIDERTLQLGQYRSGKYDDQRIIDTYRHNVARHIELIPSLAENNIRSFRISSSIFPLFEFNRSLAITDQTLNNRLQVLGRLFKERGIRVTTHPGQFTVLSSDKDSVVQNSIRELEMHAWTFDAMGFEQTAYNAINIHGGKSDRSDKLIEVINSLPDNVRNRLTLENDEKCYNVKQLMAIHEKTGVPIVFDTHHFTFNDDDYDFDRAFDATSSSWGSVKPLQHLSNTEPGNEKAAFNLKRAHSNYIHYIPARQLQAARNNTLDIDVEAKYKNLAVIKMRSDFAIEV